MAVYHGERPGRLSARDESSGGKSLIERITLALVGALVVALPTLAAPHIAGEHGAGEHDVEETATVETIVDRVEAEGLDYVFVGERHDVGPVKRFAVDLANALLRRGHDVALYVEGFRTDCGPSGPFCDDLARLFNEEAFAALLTESLAPVRALDPPERDRRADRMAATLTDASETLRIVLVGNSHVLHAGDLDAELRVYGGSVRYPNPGDLVEAFPRHRSLTVSLQRSAADASTESPYLLRADGVEADYRLVAPFRRAY